MQALLVLGAMVIAFGVIVGIRAVAKWLTNFVVERWWP